MKRYELKAYITQSGTENQKAVPTFCESESGRFVEFKDVEAIIQKAEYWEKQFRQEWKRVGELCDQREKAKRALKNVQEDLL